MTTASDRCVIGYNNYLETGTLTASSSTSDGPPANVGDWLDSDYWVAAGDGTQYIDIDLGVAKSADYFAFYNQNLYANSGTIKLQYWNGSAYVDVFSAVAPSTNAPYLTIFNTISAQKWRILVQQTGAAPYLGICALGVSLALPFGVYLGYTEPVLARTPTLINSVSDGGSFLGRSVIAKACRTTLPLQFATDAFVRSSWLDFVKHMETKPFFYCWNYASYPNECALCWAEDSIPPPSHTHYGYMGTTVNIRAKVE